MLLTYAPDQQKPLEEDHNPRAMSFMDTPVFRDSATATNGPGFRGGKSYLIGEMIGKLACVCVYRYIYIYIYICIRIPNPDFLIPRNIYYII